MTLEAKIEAVLLGSAHPVSLAKLAEILGAEREDVAQAAKVLGDRLDDEKRGIRLLRHAQSVQLTTSPEAARFVAAFLKDEQRSELTRPALETLTIIAYRGPITKADLDMIRGVNCSLIIRNLLIKGLIEVVESAESLTTTYQVTADFLRYLGVTKADSLPDYSRLRGDKNIEKLLHPTAPVEAGSEQAVAEAAVTDELSV